MESKQWQDDESFNMLRPSAWFLWHFMKQCIMDSFKHFLKNQSQLFFYTFTNMLKDCKFQVRLAILAHACVLLFQKSTIQHYFKLLNTEKCTAVYLRGILSCLTSSCLDFLCCSFSCRAEKTQNQRNGEEEEEPKVNKDLCQNRKIKNKLPLL